jgi:HlyD family secretion protein
MTTCEPFFNITLQVYWDGGLGQAWFSGIPTLDKTDKLRQARAVEAPPKLPPVAAAPKAKRKGRKKLIVASIIFVVVLAIVIWAMNGKKSDAITVQTEKVARHTITETVIANGKIYPVLQVHISPEVSGEITEMNVKEGQFVHKGDLLLKIKPDFYNAALNQAKANYQSSLASKTTAAANLEKAEAEFKRNHELFAEKLLSESEFITYKTSRDVAAAQVESSKHQVEVAKASVDSAQDSLSKTTILAPIDGTITKLNSQAGERVLGTVQNAGTDIMIISDLSAIEARVDIGEADIVNLQPGETARLEVDSFKDKKFAGVVTDVANSSQGLNASSAFGAASSSSSQTSATLFQVRIRFQELDKFRPGMSVTATIETRSRTNTIAVPIAAVTARMVRPKMAGTNSVAATNSPAASTNAVPADKKSEERNKPVEVVFVVDGDKVKTVPVKLGISDDNYYEITEGLKEGEEIVTGSITAISRTLEDGKKITKGGKEMSGK